VRLATRRARAGEQDGQRGGSLVTPGGAFDPQWRGPDGVHFTVAGQDRLAKAVYAVIKKQWAPHGLPSATPSPSSSGSASPSP
jgi:hypothetical protein